MSGLRLSVPEVRVVVVDKPRHAGLIARIRELGAQVATPTDGDVGGALATLVPGGGADVLMGVGGTPEGIIAAAALLGFGAAAVDWARAAGRTALDRLSPTQEHRAAVHAAWIHAVMTRSGDRLLHRFEDCSPEKHAHIAPSLVIVEAVQIMAGSHTCLAAGARVEIDREPVLLTGRRHGQGDEVAVVARRMIEERRGRDPADCR